jgi:hypothetical protein
VRTAGRLLLALGGIVVYGVLAALGLTMIGLAFWVAMS